MGKKRYLMGIGPGRVTRPGPGMSEKSGNPPDSDDIPFRAARIVPSGVEALSLSRRQPRFQRLVNRNREAVPDRKGRKRIDARPAAARFRRNVNAFINFVIHIFFLGCGNIFNIYNLSHTSEILPFALNLKPPRQTPHDARGRLNSVVSTPTPGIRMNRPTAQSMADLDGTSWHVIATRVRDGNHDRWAWSLDAADTRALRTARDAGKVVTAIAGNTLLAALAPSVAITPAQADHRKTWSRDSVATLRRLHTEGRSFSEIASHLGVTKNAVASQIRRLSCLEPRPSPIRRRMSA